MNESYEAEKLYLDFLDSNIKCQDRIKSLIQKEGRRLIVDLNDLRNYNKERVEKLLKNSFVELTAFQNSLKRCIANINPEFSNSREEFFVGFEGSFGERQLNPRTLTSKFLGNMVCIEGIVTNSSIVRSKLTRSVHYCPVTKKFIERNYSDITSLDPTPSSGAYPTKDEDGNLLESEFGQSIYKDSQSLTVQEMPENAPAGQLPRSIDIVLENDLVDSCKSGDRVYICGQFRVLPSKRGGFTTGIFNDILIANNVYLINQKAAGKCENIDLKDIRLLSKKPNIVDLLVRSIAPTICGHEFIKRAILLQLLGGVERLLLNGSRIRGDINVLLLGDPSVGKSQFLRFVLQCARDRAIATTGRGSTGVGLTAAVVSDKDTGERGLQAGAMVLADRGIVCIDEFDKMSDIDRTAIHEVMEQGRVTIAKAGIHAKLNARCSVLAAANPVYGRYDQYKTPMENIGLQDSLLSRFDLLFIILDQCDDELNRTIAEFVGRLHSWRAPGEEEGQVLPLQVTHTVDYVGSEQAAGSVMGTATVNGKKKTPIYESADSCLYSSGHVNKNHKFLTKDFLQKYIHVARQMSPKLTAEASEVLHLKYCELRSRETDRSNSKSISDQYRTQPVTPRTMETMIRLATAHAKARMDKFVLKADAENAADLVSYVMFQEVLKKQNKRAKPTDDDQSDVDDIGMVDDINDLTLGKKAKKMRTAAPVNDDNKENEEDEEMGDAIVTNATASSIIISESDAELLTKAVSEAFVEIHDNTMPIVQLINKVRETHSAFSEQQIRALLQRLHDNNRIMLADNDIYTL